MKVYLLISSLVIVQAGVIKESDCDGVVINNVYYEREVLKEDLDRPYLLATDYTTNTLYFSYSVNRDDDEFRTARFNLNTKEFKDIDGVKNGFAQTVDVKTHDVYLGGSDGIYKYNHNTNKAEFIGDKNVDIWIIYFKDVLYYSTFPSQFLYTLIDGTSTRFKDLEDTKVDNFIIDKDNVMYFTNSSGLYSKEKGTEKGTKDAVLYRDLPDVGVRGMTTDVNGNAHICLQDGVYSINNATTSLKKVVDIDDAFGVAFDNDNNIVYADATSLVRLKPNRDKTCF